MVPTITQQLEAMRHRFAQTIVPALSPAAEFAQEQAKLMLATFDWLLDTHEYEYRYVVVENNEYRRLLSDLAGALGDTGAPQRLRDEVRACLAEQGPAPQEAIAPLPQLAEQTRRFKQLAMSVAAALQEGAKANAVRALVADCARAQGKRELAFFRKTGFPRDAQDLRSELRPVEPTPKA